MLTKLPRRNFPLLRSFVIRGMTHRSDYYITQVFQAQHKQKHEVNYLLSFSARIRIRKILAFWIRIRVQGVKYQPKLLKKLFYS